MPEQNCELKLKIGFSVAILQCIKTYLGNNTDSGPINTEPANCLSSWHSLDRNYTTTTNFDKKAAKRYSRYHRQEANICIVKTKNIKLFGE